jgi:hypothetical protein
LGCRTPAHCIEYAHLILWSQQRSNEEFDTDNEEHMQWVYNNALTRAKQYGIEVRTCSGCRRQRYCTMLMMESVAVDALLVL